MSARQWRSSLLLGLFTRTRGSSSSRDPLVDPGSPAGIVIWICVNVRVTGGPILIGEEMNGADQAKRLNPLDNRVLRYLYTYSGQASTYYTYPIQHGPSPSHRGSTYPKPHT